MPHIDLFSVDSRLLEIEEEKKFLLSVRALLLDPRIKAIGSRPTNGTATPATSPNASDQPVVKRGEQQKAVYDVLRADGPGVTTKEITALMRQRGFVFVAKYPEIAVNESLISLGNKVRVVGRRGLAKLWAKNPEASEEAS